jgi:CxxC motif-containing protein
VYGLKGKIKKPICKKVIMKLSLYEIEKSQLEIVAQLIENGGELTEELEQALTLNKENLQTKGTNYGLIIKQLDGECAIIDSEIDRLSLLKKSRAKTVEKLKNNLSVAMQIFDIEKIETPLLKISFRKSETCEIDDAALIDKKYITEKTTESIDKTAIKAAIKAGEIVVGARIQENKNIQIK